MLDIGFQELVVIFAVAIMVFGPKRLPELSRNLGRGVGQLKKALFDVKYELSKEMKILDEESGIKNPLEEVPKWKKEALDAIYSGGGEPRTGGAQGPGDFPDINPLAHEEDASAGREYDREAEMNGLHRSGSTEEPDVPETPADGSASGDADSDEDGGDRDGGAQ